VRKLNADSKVQALAGWHSGKSATMNDKGRYRQHREMASA
jgi:hypothetical protein